MLMKLEAKKEKQNFAVFNGHLFIKVEISFLAFQIRTIVEYCFYFLKQLSYAFNLFPNCIVAFNIWEWP